MKIETGKKCSDPDCVHCRRPIALHLSQAQALAVSYLIDHATDCIKAGILRRYDDAGMEEIIQFNQWAVAHAHPLAALLVEACNQLDRQQSTDLASMPAGGRA
jgi:hypothetical protein